jgi:biotin carboxyl carrier protein
MKKYNITVNGNTYEVFVEEADGAVAAPVAAPAAPAATPAPAAAPAVTGSGEAVSAPMPGNILKVNVNVGDAVKSGAVLVVLEAMKMENEIMAPKDGTVTQVLVSKGSTVDTGAPLVVIG